MKVTEVPGQMVVAVATMDTEGVTTGFTVIVMELEVAVGVDAQPRLEVITAFITSPFAIEGGVKVARTADWIAPFTCH